MRGRRGNFGNRGRRDFSRGWNDGRFRCGRGYRSFQGGVGGGARSFSGAALRNEQGGLALPNRIRRRQRFVLGGLQAFQPGLSGSVGVGPQGVQIDQFQQIQLLLGGGI